MVNLSDFLVGALVVGTAFPHLLKGFTSDLPWRIVLIITSVLAAIGGLLILLFVPDGPHHKRSQKPDLMVIFKVFKVNKFRAAAFGYFGHMWEVYAFWAFVPIILATYVNLHPGTELNIPIWSFFIIGLGGPASVVGGYISQSFGIKKTAASALLLSGLCCLLSPLIINIDSGLTVISIPRFLGNGSHNRLTTFLNLSSSKY